MRFRGRSCWQHDRHLACPFCLTSLSSSSPYISFLKLLSSLNLSKSLLCALNKTHQKNRKEKNTHTHTHTNPFLLHIKLFRTINTTAKVVSTYNMDTYQRVEKPREETPINENEIRITAQGRMRSYITYANTLLQDKASNEIVLKAMGRAINKTVMVAELLKRRIVGLHQNTSISSTDITDTWEPLEEGLLPLETTRHVSVMAIILSKKELDTSLAGYQQPIPADQVKPMVEYDYEGGGNNKGYGGRGRGRGRGRGYRGLGRGYGARFIRQEPGGYNNFIGPVPPSTQGRGRSRGRGRSWGRGQGGGRGQESTTNIPVQAAA